MTKVSSSNYTDAQVSIILAAIAANGNVANASVAKTLSDDPRMRAEGDSQPRSTRSLTAKMRRMADTNDFRFERKQPTTKDGKPVTKKLDLVARIAAAAGTTAEALDGMEKAPKQALDLIAEAIEALREEADAATGTEG